MAARKDKHVMINDESESSHDAAAAATKRRRIHEVMNGVPFTNPTTEFPSNHLRNPPRNTTSIDLQLSPPAEEQGDADDEDDVLSSVISQQNFLISYHMSEMQVSVEEVWRRNLWEVVKKRKEMERRLKEKEEETSVFRKMYNLNEDKVFLLEEKLQQIMRRAAGEGCSATGVEEEEEVESNYVERMRFHLACLNCLNRAATMVWLPCRHLCVCLVCERRVKRCPVCGAEKTHSIMIDNLP